MKKIVMVISLIGSMLIGGVVSAATTNLWGSYKGNDIIRLTVNGDPVKLSDVPAISYNGRTMIPIYLLQQAGINYKWDQSNQTVDIIPQSEVNININKEFIRKANLYKDLEDLGENLNDVIKSYDLAILNIAANNSDDSQARLANTKMNFYINKYNEIIQRSDFIEFSKYDNNVHQTMNGYFDSLELLKQIDSLTYQFLSGNTPYNLDSYSNLADSVRNKINNSIKLSTNGYSSNINNSLK
ncbi:stalk domain-containing protein [Paenibacillus macerans]|uniref:stalk domain-containing protein n=1 Tax=Paenibacillus macerans TaxID=44252 RepID=UPI00204090CC|nr:stalk domain-containing protein [Paenibacillus macerans]MCM3703783.1 copper amine oxidase N-terminal domain-containing protein [Paenibacillus macerans]